MDFTEIRRAVRKGRGQAIVSVRELRECAGKGRAGTRVVQEISAALVEDGFGHLPFELPRDQDRKVLIYLADSETGRLLDAVGRTASPGPRSDAAVATVDRLLVRG
ncbi:hypothetical protein [Streptomyces lonarensis]|uniref:Uncharacterized protein n=1 Tax=Streptomyces lonarensis TaxID=700599 RepID=A0A7X6I0Q3_9ACTN|nr:hypothetical protein [Streptomyces lonarensis]NJQ07755.1 hypothetical protein [Streptomyces lonarensis]